MGLNRRNMTGRVVPLRSKEASKPPSASSAAERLSLVRELSLQAWKLTGRALPDEGTTRSTVSIRPLRESPLGRE